MARPSSHVCILRAKDTSYSQALCYDFTNFTMRIRIAQLRYGSFMEDGFSEKRIIQRNPMKLYVKGD